MRDRYRTRIYSSYVENREQNLAPDDLDGLKPRAPYLRKLVNSHFPADKAAVIIELGCGHGALLHFAREAGYDNIRGVDGSSQQVAAARQLGIEGVERGDLVKTLSAQTDASFDVVVAFDVIEHFTRDELLDIVDAVHRVLKPQGRWIIHTPNGESPFVASVLFGDLTHELAFTRTSLAQLLLSSGFMQVRCFEDTPIPHGVKSLVRWVLWKVFRNMLRLYTAAETGDAGSAHIFSRNLLAVATK
jgi:2-polyprenyl-3-methyl-5-hydroxy-6-metoxy-1,4-benzoquinol methylase